MKSIYLPVIMDYFVFYIILYLPLLVIAVVFLFKALKRKNGIQIIIFSVCIIFCVYSIAKSYLNYTEMLKEEKEFDKLSLRSFPVGDTTTIKGIILFNRVDPYEKQDSLNKIYNERLNRIYIVMLVNYSGELQENTQMVELSPGVFSSVKGYLDYEQQNRDKISYSLRLKVRKIAQDLRSPDAWANHWELIEIINIKKLNKPPFPL